MLSKRYSRWAFAGALCACALLAGCGEPATDAVPVAAATAVALPPSPVDAEPAEPTLAQNEPAAADSKSAPLASDYKPPFPERVDLFVTPKREGGGAVADGGNNGAVVLNGFVNVDRPRAVLTVDGQMSPVAEGESLSGVEVISIQPPKVILQRGRQRWQVTLE